MLKTDLKWTLLLLYAVVVKPSTITRTSPTSTSPDVISPKSPDRKNLSRAQPFGASAFQNDALNMDTASPTLHQRGVAGSATASWDSDDPAVAMSRSSTPEVIAGVQLTSCVGSVLSKIGSKTSVPRGTAASGKNCSGNLDSDRVQDRGLCPWSYKVNEVKDGSRIPRVLMEAECHCALSVECKRTETPFLSPSCKEIYARIPVLRCTATGDACWSDVDVLAVGCACVFDPVYEG